MNLGTPPALLLIAEERAEQDEGVKKVVVTRSYIIKD